MNGTTLSSKHLRDVSRVGRWLLALLVCSGMTAPASALTINYGTEFSGSGATTAVNPFATAVISDLVGGVSMTITLDPLLNSGAYVSAAYFNYGTTSTDVSTLAGATRSTGGTQPPLSVQVSYNSFKADGDGYFDVMMSYPTSGDKFIASDNSSVIFTLFGISAALFNNQSSPTNANGNGGGGTGPFLSALHVQGLPGGLSGWFSGTVCPGDCAPPPPPEVPLPPALFLFGTGLVGLTILGRRRRSA